MGFKSSELNHSTLYDRVKKLLVSYEWSDCSFFVSGKNFKAHKLILGITSPVFEAMFYGPLSNSNDIIITDIEPDVFQLLLNYIYTDKVEIPSIEEAFELLYVSRKYLLEQLSDLCITYIQANLSIDNVTAILNYPDFMQDKALKSSALKLFCEHASYLLQENKRLISPSCMKTILESNQMNLKEKDLIKHVFHWSTICCDLNDIPESLENKRNILISNNLFKLLRFFTLRLDELDDIVTDSNNVLLPGESKLIKKVINQKECIKEDHIEQALGATLVPRNSLKLHWNLCHRSALRSMAPIIIDSNNNTAHTKIRANKSIFITSLCIPTRMGPVLNFRSDVAKVYSEQISVSMVDQSDNSIIKFTNFMNTVEYDSMVDIELSEPCFIKKGKWYKINFEWPQTSYITCSYVVEYRDRLYEDQRLKLEFEDILPEHSGSFLNGLKYCL